MSRDIFVLCEYKRGTNVFREGTFELLSAARGLKKQGREEFNTEYRVNAIVLDSGLDSDFSPLFKFGADKVIYLKNEKFKHYDQRYFTSAMIKLLEEKNPEILLISATNIGRELAPSITSRIDTGLTADCTALSLKECRGDVRLCATRPTFGGVLMAAILCRKNPQCATVREGVLEKIEKDTDSFEVEEFLLPYNFSLPSLVRLMEFIPDRKKNINLENAKIILAGGRGLKTKENFEKLERLSNLLNATWAASRGAVEKKLAPQERQIGQTGKTVSPELYIAFGISGAIHHISGMSSSKTVCAINTDPNAPIFCHSDYKITADAQEVLDNLLKRFDT